MINSLRAGGTPRIRVCWEQPLFEEIPWAPITKEEIGRALKGDNRSRRGRTANTNMEEYLETHLQDSSQDFHRIGEQR
jgi:hypothetical protein